MARCPSCLASIPFAAPLRHLFMRKGDPRARLFLCPGCGKTASLSRAAQFMSILFIVVCSTTSAVWMLTNPWLNQQPWFGPATIFVPLFGNFIIFYCVWWKFIAKLQNTGFDVK